MTDNKPKILFLFLVILIISLPLHAQISPVINFNAGNIGYGGNFPLIDDYSSETIFTLLNFGLEDTYTNIGFEFSPLNAYNWASRGTLIEENEDMKFSLFNLSLYWNALNHSFGPASIYTGPFTSISYMFVDEELYWDRYVFTAGLHFGFRANMERFNYNIASFEMGYRNIDGVHKYFIGGKVDLVVVFVAIIAAAASSARDTDGNTLDHW